MGWGGWCLPRNFPPELGGVDACWWELPKAGAESGRLPALIGVETALTEADGPWLLLALIVALSFEDRGCGETGEAARDTWRNAVLVYGSNRVSVQDVVVDLRRC
uniref:Uncharacterized protein n=1 Tax=Anopheles farauti TaxID=69004 RepID=A0A182QYI2_9DIPT